MLCELLLASLALYIKGPLHCFTHQHYTLHDPPGREGLIKDVVKTCKDPVETEGNRFLLHLSTNVLENMAKNGMVLWFSCVGASP